MSTLDEIEHLMFPRLAAIAEIAWSPRSTHDWSAFRHRLGAQAPRWTAMGVRFARLPGVPWVVESPGPSPVPNQRGGAAGDVTQAPEPGPVLRAR